MPDARQLPYALTPADDPKPASRLKREASDILSNCGALQRPDAVRFCGFNERFQQSTTDSSRSRGSCYIDSYFGYAGIACAL